MRSLKEKGLLTSVENTRDTRSKILVLTENGRTLSREISTYSNEIAEKISGLHMSEKAVLLEGLQTLVGKVSKLTSTGY